MIPLREHTSQANLVKLATVTRESWIRNGWEPEVLRARDAEHKLRLNGKLFEVGTRCPVWLYDYLPALAEKGGGWFTESDVYNNGFSPREAERFNELYPGRIISLKSGFGCGAMFYPPALIPELIQVLYAMDEGRITTRSDFPNLESYLRERETAVIHPVTAFPFCDPDWQSFPLWHLTTNAVKNFV